MSDESAVTGEPALEASPTGAPPSDTPTEDEAEVEAWRNVDPNDPQAVARALAALGMRVGAKMSVVEHMHARIGRAVEAVEQASAKLDQLATRQELEDRVHDLEADLARQRSRDRRRLTVGIGALVVVLAALFVCVALLLSTAATNRATGEYLRECTTPGTRTPTLEDPATGNDCYDEQQRRSAVVVGELYARQEATAICTRLFGDEATIRSCIDERVARAKASTGVPSKP